MGLPKDGDVLVGDVAGVEDVEVVVGGGGGGGGCSVVVVLVVGGGGGGVASVEVAVVVLGQPQEPYWSWQLKRGLQ